MMRGAEIRVGAPAGAGPAAAGGQTGKERINGEHRHRHFQRGAKPALTMMHAS